MPSSLLATDTHPRHDPISDSSCHIHDNDGVEVWIKMARDPEPKQLMTHVPAGSLCSNNSTLVPSKAPPDQCSDLGH